MLDSIATAGTVQPTSGARRTVQIMIWPDSPLLTVDTWPFAKNFKEGDLADFNDQFVSVLDDIRLEVLQKDVKLTQNSRDRYLLRMREIGKAAANTVLDGGAGERLAQLDAQERARGLCLTFTTPKEMSFSWEMVYTGKNRALEDDQFWGFRYPLGRTYWGVDAPDLIRLQDGVFSAVHDELPLSKQEVQELAHQVLAVCQREGLKLTLKLLDQEIPLDKLSLDRMMDLFHGEEFRYGMVHFACHFDNHENTGASQAYLSMTGHKKTLDLYLEKLIAWREYGFRYRPFVFLNACGSATAGHLLQTLSFPTGIIGFGAGGVIATACTVPDSFASAFGAEFYRRLLGLAGPQAPQPPATEPPARSQSANIGEALLQTRLHFLNEYNNPLGLAYGLYAVSNQQLRLRD